MAKSANALLQALEVLGYQDDPQLMTNLDGEHPRGSGPVQYQWQDLRSRVGLEAAFFQDGVPLVGFTSEDAPEGLRGLRKRMWNYGRIPVLISARQDVITVYNSFALSNRESEVDGGILDSFRRGSSASGLVNTFSRRGVETGQFAQKYSDSFKRATRVDGALLSNMAFLRSSIAGNDKRARDAFDGVLGGCLTARYLEDREILSADRVFEMCGLHTLSESLQAGQSATMRLFNGLAEHFNGDVFGGIPLSLRELSDSDLSRISQLLRGDELRTGQLSLWPYDFSVIPTDLVSSIYEQLLEDQRRTDAAYYTPRFLVDVVLDELLPWGPRGKATRLIDLSCGSGAFITEAFRRIAYSKAIELGSKPTFLELRTLLVESVFGIDINPAAVRVTAFGLYLALLEQVDPPNVWEEVYLPKLIGSNILVADAFAEHNLSKQSFDLVVGNPPWASALSQYAQRYISETRLPIADKQIAQVFLWRALELLDEGGKLGLVMPSKPLLYNQGPTARAFRMRFFSEAEVHSIVDLSAVRHNVFSAAIAPAAVMVASKRNKQHEPESANDDIIYIAVHPRYLSSAIGRLVITPEDVKEVSGKLASCRPDIWKTLLWGGLRDIDLLDSLRSSFDTVGTIAARNGWIASQGYQVGGGDSYDASSMIGMRDVRGQYLGPLKLDQPGYGRFEYETLHRTRRIELFQGPRMIAKRTLVDRRIAAVLVQNDATFSNAMVGVGGPHADVASLAVLTAATTSSLGRYWHFYTSASWGVERDFLELNELLSLPMPIPLGSNAQEILELVMDVQESAAPESMARLDSAIFDLYGIDSLGREQILAGLDQGPVRFAEGVNATRPASAEESRLYEDRLESVLAGFLPELAIRTSSVSQGGYRVVMATFGIPGAPKLPSSPPYVLSDQTSSDLAQSVLEISKPESAETTGIVVQPSGFFVDQDTIYIVKTNDRDRWSFASAMDDGERMLAAILMGGGDA